MTRLDLTEGETSCIRQLLLTEDEVDDLERWRAGLEGISRLLACDDAGVEVVDADGCLERTVGRPEPGCTPARDTLRLDCALGGGRVVRLHLVRRAGAFGPRDVVLLAMLEPALRRLFRPTVPNQRLTTLSAAERRVIRLVAAGASNPEVAEQLGVSEATVRKHLEHSYRKLGVANRTAAAAMLQPSTTV